MGSVWNNSIISEPSRQERGPGLITGAFRHGGLRRVSQHKLSPPTPPQVCLPGKVLISNIREDAAGSGTQASVWEREKIANWHSAWPLAVHEEHLSALGPNSLHIINGKRVALTLWISRSRRHVSTTHRKLLDSAEENILIVLKVVLWNHKSKHNGVQEKFWPNLVQYFLLSETFHRIYPFHFLRTVESIYFGVPAPPFQSSRIAEMT